MFACTPCPLRPPFNDCVRGRVGNRFIRMHRPSVSHGAYRYHDVVGGGRCAVVDTFWQTERCGDYYCLLLSCSHRLTPFQCDVMSLPSLRVSLSLVYFQSDTSPLHILSLRCAPFVGVLPVLRLSPYIRVPLSLAYCSGGHLVTPLPGATPTKPGSATLPFFGIDLALLDGEGKVRPCAVVWSVQWSKGVHVAVERSCVEGRAPPLTPPSPRAPPPRPPASFHFRRRCWAMTSRVCCVFDGPGPALPAPCSETTPGGAMCSAAPCCCRVW